MISQTTEYALRAMAYLAAKPEEARTASQIAKANALPSGYVVRVMQLLRDAGLVTAQRGPRGGFLLARSIDRINLLDVVTAVGPIPRIEKCPLGNPAHLQLCPLHRRLDAAMASVEQAFASTTLAELVAEIKENDRQCQFPSRPTLPTVSAVKSKVM
jgi:Rrf2 family transcriptional regulator, nitric oxide-sensitive transcriptional repressor